VARPVVPSFHKNLGAAVKLPSHLERAHERNCWEFRQAVTRGESFEELFSSRLRDTFLPGLF